MRAESLKFLERLLTEVCPSSREVAAQRVWCEYVRPFADEIRTDAYGNAAAVLNPDAEPRILIDGHIDEIGMIVKHIDEKGFLYVQRVGGVNPALLQGKRVRILTAKGEVRGVFGATAIHLRDRSKGNEQKAPKMHECPIDIGAADGKAARKQVAVGDFVAFTDDYEMLNKNVVVGRALDNRVGCWVAAEVLRMVKASKTKPKCCLIACSSIQEETGLNGAQMQVANHQPHAVMAVDVTHATDTPGIDVKQHGEVKFGKGPTIAIGRENHPVLVERLRKVASTKKIPIQIETFSVTGGTDAYAYWTKNGGIPATIVSVPNRYMHSTVEMVDLRDLQHTADWLAAFVQSVKKNERFAVEL